MPFQSDSLRQPEPKSNLSLWFQSALGAGTSEMIGRDPTAAVDSYRNQSPVGGVTSQMAGMLLPYSLPQTRIGQAGIKALPLFGRGLKTAETLAETRPVLGGALTEMAKYAPFEMGRTGITAATGGDVERIAREGVFNWMLSGGIGGGIGAFRQMGQMPPKLGIERQAQALDPTIDLGAPMQLRLQKYQDLLARSDLEENFRRQLNRRTQEMDGLIRQQRIPEGRQAVQRMEGKGESGGSQALNRLWAFRDDKLFRVSAPIQSKRKGGFGKAWDEVKAQLDFNLPESWSAHAYLPRVLEPKGPKGVAQLESTLERQLERVGSGTWIGKEKDGMFVYVQRMGDELIEGPNPSIVSHPNRYFMTKTDQPSFFNAEMSQFGNAQSRALFNLERRLPGDKILRKTPLGKFADQAYEEILGKAALVGDGKFKGAIREALKALIPEETLARLSKSSGGATDILSRIAKTYMSPTTTQFGGKSGSMRGAAIMAFAKAMMDRAAGMSAQAMSGTSIKGAKGSLYSMIWKPEERINSLYKAIDDLDEKTLMELTRMMWRGADDISDLSKPTQDFVNKFLWPVDQRQVFQIKQTQKATGIGNFQDLDNHYMLSRMWVGPLRIELRDTKGMIRGYAAGHTPQEVRKEAELIKKIALEEDNLDLAFNPASIKRPRMDEDFAQAMAVQKPETALRWTKKARTPERFQEREGMVGGLGYTRALDKKELRELLGKNIRESQNYMAMQVVRHKTGKDLSRLHAEDPQMAKLVIQRLNDLEGVKGPGVKWLESAVDNMLTPIIGTSAIQLARGTNELMFHLTLGFGNLGFAGLNALTFMQTSLPEAAFALTSRSAQFQSYYGVGYMATANGGLQTVRYLEPGRILKQAFRQMSKPDAELRSMVVRAREEQIISPRLAAEVFGPDSNIVNHFKQFWKGDKNVLDFAKEASAYLPARTEELARMISFIMGKDIGKMRGLEGEALYRMASQFTSQSMYRYTTADRSRVFTGAFGSVYGLFKNWMFNYIANTGRFLGEGFYRGNWAPLLWQQAGSVSVAGLGGSLLYPVAEGFASLTSDQTALEQLYTGYGFYDVDTDGVSGRATDALFYGLPAFLGVSLQHRAIVPGAIPTNDIEQLYSAAVLDRGAAMGRLFGETFARVGRMEDHPANDRRVRDAMASAFAPRTLQAYFARTEDGGLRSLRSGNMLFDDATTADHVANMFGFRTTDMSKAYSASRELFKEQETYKNRISYYGEVLTQARLENDPRAEMAVFQQAYREGVPWERVVRSADAREAKRNTGLIERSFEKEQRTQKLQILGLE